MSSCKKLSFLFVFLFVFNAWSMSATDAAVNFLCYTVLSGHKYDDNNFFSASFLENKDKDDFALFIKQIVETLGVCTEAKVSSSSKNEILILAKAKKGALDIELFLDDDDLIYHMTVKHITLDEMPLYSWDDLIHQLTVLSANISLTILPFNGEKKQYNNHIMQPLASCSKLYILLTLANMIKAGHFRWDDKFPIKEECKSLPSGIMHNKKNGELYSLYSFAEHMILLSDNTAADHILDIIGREQVEATLKNLDNQFLSNNLPFLSTSELFKIKLALQPQLVKEYVALNNQSRKRMLNTVVKNISLFNVNENSFYPDSPVYIKDVEWFGSSDDLCQLMFNLKKCNCDNIMDILGQAPPLVKLGPDKYWQYAGFKGGSEPGVLTSSYLLQNHKKEWMSIAFCWHDETKVINQIIFFYFLQKIIELLEIEDK